MKKFRVRMARIIAGGIELIDALIFYIIRARIFMWLCHRLLIPMYHIKPIGQNSGGMNSLWQHFLNTQTLFVESKYKIALLILRAFIGSYAVQFRQNCFTHADFCMQKRKNSAQWPFNGTSQSCSSLGYNLSNNYFSRCRFKQCPYERDTA